MAKKVKKVKAKAPAKLISAATAPVPEQFMYGGQQMFCYVCEVGLTTIDEILTMPDANHRRIFVHRKCRDKVQARARELRAAVSNE